MPSAFSRERMNMIEERFADLLEELQNAKAMGDRNEQARYLAITITEVEKAKAVFLTYVKEPTP